MTGIRTTRQMFFVFIFLFFIVVVVVCFAGKACEHSVGQELLID